MEIQWKARGGGYFLVKPAEGKATIHAHIFAGKRNEIEPFPFFNWLGWIICMTSITYEQLHTTLTVYRLPTLVYLPELLRLQ